MEESKNRLTFKVGDTVLIKSGGFGSITEVLPDDRFRVTFWENGSAGRSEGIFTSDKLTITSDLPPFNQ